MIYKILADIVVLIHFFFILFAVFGGLFLVWNKKIAWLHLPVVIWAAVLEFFGIVCPLTPFEAWLRSLGGGPAYLNGFIEHYIIPVLYPTILTRELQIVLGGLVIFINLLVYGVAFFGQKKEIQE